MNAVYVLNVGEESQAIGNLTIPLIRAYADRHNLQFVEYNDPNYSPFPSVHFLKFKIFEDAIEKKFENIIYIDIDILVDKHAPDLSGMTSLSNFRWQGSKQNQRYREKCIRVIEKQTGITWPSDVYFNDGLMSLRNKDIQALLWLHGRRTPFSGPDYEQAYMNYLIVESGIVVKYLDDRKYNYCPKRYRHEGMRDALFCHYLGTPFRKKRELIQTDLKNYADKWQ
jgi:hypothetical protein